MRGIESADSAKKKQRRNQIIIGVVLVVIMLGSTFGIIVDSFGNKDKEGKIIYNGIEFTKMEGVWVATKGNLQLIFSYNPKETENITSSVKFADNYYGKPLYVYSPDKNAEREIYRNFDPRANAIVSRIQSACPEGKTCEADVPIKDCSNNFIIIEESNSTNIKQDRSCVFINGPKEKILEITDEFMFKVFEIKQ